MNGRILITGGTGLMGKPLTERLLSEGYDVNILSRKAIKSNHKSLRYFKWDVNAQQINPQALHEVDTIVHLAGEGIADKRWTAKRKQEIIQSRTASIRLLYDQLRNNSAHTVRSIISASAIGYYSDRGESLMTEESTPNSDFLAESCIAWEAAVDEGKSLNLRIVKLRTGIVLDEAGGALKPMGMAAKFGLSAALGSGKQWMSWIHMDDAVDMYLFAIENQQLHGVFNMVAPNPVRNTEFTKILGSAMHKPAWLPNVPAFALKLGMGEMSTVVLGSTKVSAEKIIRAGFQFKYPELAGALAEIYGK